jgi:FixJ family two-component response regulator
MGAAGTTRPVRVALVDNDESIRTALRRLLSALGHHPEVFGSGQAFLDSPPIERHECLIVDMHMPGMSGLEILRHLGERGIRLPTLMVTAFEEGWSREQCLAAGASAYLRKPLDDVLLSKAIAEAVR